jgi:two-component sensor histidine kinase
VICLFVLQAKAQKQSDNSPKALTYQIQNAKNDSNKIKLELKLGSYYLDKDGEFKNDLDSAFTVLRQAKKSSDSLHLIKWQLATLKLRGNYYLQTHDLRLAKSCLTEIINYYDKAGDQLQKAKTWSYFGDCILTQDPDSRVLEKRCYEMAYRLYKQQGDKLDAINAYVNLADQHLRDNELDLAEKQLTDAIEQYKSLNYKKLAYTYSLLAEVSRLKGNPNKQLYYSLEVIKTANATADTGYISYYYYKLAMVYKDLKMYDQNEYYLNETLMRLRREGDFYHFHNMLSDYAQDLIAQHQPARALTYLQKQIKETPPKNDREKYFVSMGFAACYHALGQNAKAEKYYLEMIRLSDIESHDNILRLHTHMEDYETISEFYVSLKQYGKARFFLDKISSMPSDKTSPPIISRIQLLFFKVDSASQQYLSAISHFQLYKKLDDSIFSVAKNNQIAEVQVKYESSKKDEALLLQGKDIQILKKQTQLVTNEAQKSRTFRNFSVAASVMLLAILALGYNRYRLKQRSNNLLELNQKIISDKNSRLEKLLHDNEWLLKEVHHRVKNNLQLITNLLQSQSAYLRDNAAIEAITESRHRVHAMSLIHHKLYKTTNVSTISMPEYVAELVDNLRGSFKAQRNIVFDLVIEPINLNVVQAVPVGLILNEAITNTLKYAFPNPGNDCVTIRLSQSAANELTLIVADNGVGLPEDFDFNKINSFGMTLIHGLAEDLYGTCSIVNSGGTHIEIKFKSENHKTAGD